MYELSKKLLSYLFSIINMYMKLRISKLRRTRLPGKVDDLNDSTKIICVSIWLWKKNVKMYTYKYIQERFIMKILGQYYMHKCIYKIVQRLSYMQFRIHFFIQFNELIICLKAKAFCFLIVNNNNNYDCRITNHSIYIS